MHEVHRPLEITILDKDKLIETLIKCTAMGCEPIGEDINYIRGYYTCLKDLGLIERFSGSSQT